jgi:hypothetical protein
MLTATFFMAVRLTGASGRAGRKKSSPADGACGRT